MRNIQTATAPINRGREIIGADIGNFRGLKITVASPEQILAWSYGEVLKPETINYRTQRPEREGLFDERIFGPTKDFECYCGKYKKIRYKGVICDKCGVEVTRSAVRRERMGHIDLAVPIAHIWYIRGVPSILSLVTDMGVSDLEKVIYFAGFVILEVDEDIRRQALEQLENEFRSLKKGQSKISDWSAVEADYRQTKQELEGLEPKKVISESKFHDLSLKYGRIIKVSIGAEAIHKLLLQLDLESEIKKLEQLSQSDQSLSRRRVMRRLKILSDMRQAGVKPSWLIFIRLPVIPPDLRPMVQLDGGRFATSDLNDLYRRVINRNNRLKRLIKQGAPEVICRNEKRMLQEAVDALIDNSSRKGRAVTTATARKLRSLADILRGKQGRFRQNLLGKRVDYSGRSVIVVGPELKLHQCGLPKVMALELFKTFVISRLISEGYVHNVKNASRLIEKGTPEVWDILERITNEYYVLLNRAPTLHRLGIQAFQPVLIEGKAIQIHPLVCYAFNADFDGDQMAVHVPLSSKARYETREIMRSSHNLLKPASGEPVVSPRLDIVLGCFFLTSIFEASRGEGKIFSSKNEAILAYHQGFVDVRAKIKVMVGSEILEASVGRILFNNILPEEMQFLNQSMDSKTLKTVVQDCFTKYGQERTAELVDDIKDLGFEYAGFSGMTISIDDIFIPADKKAIIGEAENKLEQIDAQYRRGLITETERSIKTIELWTEARSKIEAKMIAGLDENNPVSMMVRSGARGSINQITQLGGMKGLVVNPSGEIIEVPIRANFKEGLDVLEYFISTHGARKGKSDTSLRTSDAGYLTRRLIDVAQDTIIGIEDCGSKNGIIVSQEESDEVGQDFYSRILGRVLVEDAGKIEKGTLLDRNTVAKIKSSGVKQIKVRSVLTCLLERSVCRRCYGQDLATGNLIEPGEAVGIMAAQAIGEPGTQLTMKTFHLGGVTGEDITSGLPRVEELFEARSPRTPAIMAELDGEINIANVKGKKFIEIISHQKEEKSFLIPPDYQPAVKKGDIVRVKQAVATAPDKKSIRTTIGGTVKSVGGKIVIFASDIVSRQYPISDQTILKVHKGDKVTRGQELSEGHIDLETALKLKGMEWTQKYIIRGVQEIYASQGQTINDKHIELIVKQMFSKVKIIDGGSSKYLPGQIVARFEVERENQKFKKENRPPISFEETVMGITRVALKTDSFLSAASFQETTNVLIEAAIKGDTDNLRGLKENVIIGRLIPAGTGLIKDFRKGK